MQSFLIANDKRAFGTLVGEYIWKVSGFNMLLEIVFLVHSLVADPTAEWTILRVYNVLIEILRVSDVTLKYTKSNAIIVLHNIYWLKYFALFEIRVTKTNFLDADSVCVFLMLSWSPLHENSQDTDMRISLGNAWTQHAAWCCSSYSCSGCRSHSSKTHLPQSEHIAQDLVGLWWGLN